MIAAPCFPRHFCVIIFAVALTALCTAQTITPAMQQVPLPGSPFAAAVTPDGHYIFASLSGNASGVAMIQQDGPTAKLLGVLSTNLPVFGLAVTSDGKYLLDTVQGISGVQIIDVRQAIAGSPNPIIATVPLAGFGPIEIALSRDDRFAFVANEGSASVTVIDVQAALSLATSAVVGDIPVEQDPVGLAVSPDDRRLYVTNELANPTDQGYDPTACLLPTGATIPLGRLTVIDLPRAKIDPAGSVLTSIYAGCSPVRVVLSHEGHIAWVAARAENDLLAFNTRKILNDPANALISITPVGVAPVGLQLFEHDRLIAVSNSNRFAVGQDGTVSILRTAAALHNRGAAATLGSFDAGEFPRQWALSPDGCFLYLTEYSSNVLAVIPVRELIKDLYTADAH